MPTELFLSRITICISLLCGANVLISPQVFGQGAINFNNRAVGANPVPVVAPIYGFEPANPTLSLRGNATTNGGNVTYTGPLLSGTGWTVQLWAAPQGGALTPISTTVMQPAGPLAGFIVPPSPAPTIPGAPGGSQVTFDVRIWENRNHTITTWAQVMADPNVVHGGSGTFTTAVAELPNAPPNLVGLTSFNLFAIPEPGLASLALVGGIVLLMRLSLKRRSPADPRVGGRRNRFG